MILSMTLYFLYAFLGILGILGIAILPPVSRRILLWIFWIFQATSEEKASKKRINAILREVL